MLVQTEVMCLNVYKSAYDFVPEGQTKPIKGVNFICEVYDNDSKEVGSSYLKLKIDQKSEAFKIKKMDLSDFADSVKGKNVTLTLSIQQNSTKVIDIEVE